MKTCLLLGSNLGNREALLVRARLLIGQDCGHIAKASKVYETPPWGFEADTAFLNQALLIDTPLSSEALLACCLRIETLLGRIRADGAEGYSSRCIDIDMLFYQDLICKSPELTLPHPHLHLRRFALEPLAEVAPEWKHPVLGLTAAEMLRQMQNLR
ncbi:MAG: 2-amino-4-hydroxy-6-hydroxymethyldihydropteridine diphosphokinase [Bacteroidales bacterium]|nr:2-amino-4-hydroxy-6-hydroxymethyldihydropteridine diphosphokinase [Bacteroidales bacterium]